MLDKLWEFPNFYDLKTLWNNRSKSNLRGQKFLLELSYACDVYLLLWLTSEESLAEMYKDWLKCFGESRHNISIYSMSLQNIDEEICIWWTDSDLKITWQSCTELFFSIKLEKINDYGIFFIDGVQISMLHSLWAEISDKKQFPVEILLKKMLHLYFLDCMLLLFEWLNGLNWLWSRYATRATFVKRRLHTIFKSAV